MIKMDKKFYRSGQIEVRFGVLTYTVSTHGGMERKETDNHRRYSTKNIHEQNRKRTAENQGGKTETSTSEYDLKAEADYEETAEKAWVAVITKGAFHMVLVRSKEYDDHLCVRSSITNTHQGAGHETKHLQAPKKDNPLYWQFLDIKDLVGISLKHHPQGITGHIKDLRLYRNFHRTTLVVCIENDKGERQHRVVDVRRPLDYTERKGFPGLKLPKIHRKSRESARVHRADLDLQVLGNVPKVRPGQVSGAGRGSSTAARAEAPPRRANTSVQYEGRWAVEVPSEEQGPGGGSSAGIQDALQQLLDSRFVPIEGMLEGGRL